jgi:hypothetical protein
MLVIPHAGMTADGIEQAAGAFHTEKFVGAVING